MKKQNILKAVLVEIEKDLARQLAANELASEGATHCEAKAESKWDTCGLEQSYLARGHAKQFANLVQQLEELRSFLLLNFTDKPIGVGALVVAEMAGEKMYFFILKCGGGIEVQEEGKEVTVITPESPVGAALMDKKEGDSYSFRAGMNGHILSVR